MGHEIDLKNYEIRTDLVLDTIENNHVDIKSDTYSDGDIRVTKVNVDEDSSKILNKRVGSYVTIEFDDVTDTGNRNKVEEVFIRELKNMISSLGICDSDTVLVLGLGNDKSTPDSLGPKVIENVLVTRHLFVLGEDVSSGIREVSAISPGVMASTGIETASLVNSIVSDIKPTLVLVVDALAASSIGRINKSIQITDTGIHPGSGVGNMRREISKSTIGSNVIAIGIPTVVESSIIVYDAINYLFKHISYIKENQNMNRLIVNRYNYLDKIKDKNLSTEEKKSLVGLLGELSDTEQKNLINEVLTSLNYNLIVTPKEVDFQIEKLASIVSSGINRSLHSGEV